tara:strand:- start:362 stop:1231 length:870 start_codon:yes stop_codon:yes gene_type:complete
MDKHKKESFLTFAEGAKLPDSTIRPHGWKTWSIFWVLLISTIATTYLAGGALFSISLILILGTHEFAHYWASRRNHVQASLPFFVPAPPLFLAGTFGAFIHIKDPIPNRRVLMEIGAAGPIAGFIVAIPVLSIGLFLSEVGPGSVFYGMAFGNSIILSILSKVILGADPSASDVSIMLHPVAFAGWIGMLVTALNLLPIGHLDGGHVIYAMLKDRFVLLSRLFFAILFPLGLYWNGWWFWAVLVAILGFRPAPVIHENIDLSKEHKWLGWIAIFIFLTTFIPVPFKFIY